MAKGGGPEPQGGGGNDNSLDLLWIFVCIILAALLIWYYGKTQITQAVFFVRYYEIIGIKWLIGLWAIIAQKISTTLYIHLPVPDYALLNSWQQFAHTNKEAVDFDVLLTFSSYVGKYLRYLTAFVLAPLAIYIYLKNPLQRFKNIFTMKTLKTTEQKEWPQILPIAGLDLANTSLDEKPWAMALNPLRFCEKYGLMKKEKNKDGSYNIFLIRGAAYRIMSLQLGPRWRGHENLPMYLQALFAIFIARIGGEKQIAEKLVNQIALSMPSDQLNFMGIKEVIEKHKNNSSVLRVIANHSYITTVMASLLSASREVGVLASAEFIWLKALDRRMWYMLNSVGRPTAFAEIAGAYAHWLAEKKLGLSLSAPMVDEAVNGLDIALKEIIYRPKEE